MSVLTLKKDAKTSCTRVVLHSPMLRQYFLAPVSDVEIPVVFARKQYNILNNLFFTALTFDFSVQYPYISTIKIKNSDTQQNAVIRAQPRERFGRKSLPYLAHFSLF